MYFVVFISLFFITSISLSYLSFDSKKSSMQIINDMGIGLNIGNSFDCYSTFENIENPDEQIKLCGNGVLTKQMFTRIKKYKFKTIRFPVTWKHFIDENNRVNSEWMSRVREVVDWIIEENMYCIINLQGDGESGIWLYEGIRAKEKFVSLWKQIAEEFKHYDEHLIFESMNDVEYKIGDIYDYLTLAELTQAFVDTVRNSGGNNNYRLLLIAGANKEIELTYSPDYKMPIDPFNKLAISLHYHLPAQFCMEYDDNPWTYIDNGQVKIVNPITKWGSETDYNDMVSNFETIKKYFVDKGIPVIITEVGTLTEQKKEKDSIREYLNFLFSLSADYKGIMSCLWDTSKYGDSNFYNRDTDQWYDEKIKENFKKIARGKYIKPSEYFLNTISITTTEPDPDGFFTIYIGKLKVVTAIFNAKIESNRVAECGFGITSINKNGGWTGEGIWCGIGVKQYDGTYIYTYDIRDKDFNDNIQIQKWWGHDLITINYLTVEFKESHLTINYKSYKNDLGEI